MRTGRRLTLPVVETGETLHSSCVVAGGRTKCTFHIDYIRFVHYQFHGHFLAEDEEYVASAQGPFFFLVNIQLMA
jgi:hypothetical protein